MKLSNQRFLQFNKKTKVHQNLPKGYRQNLLNAIGWKMATPIRMRWMGVWPMQLQHHLMLKLTR